MKPFKRSTSAFTLVEMIVAAGIVAILGAVMFTILSMGMTLYAQNVAINQTHAGSLVSGEKLLFKMAAAAETPVLVDDAGAAVSGNGPAAGVRFFYPASSLAYPVPSAVAATAMSFTITKSASQPAPQVGDKMALSDLGFSAAITSVSSAGSSYTVGFASAVGNGFSPVKTSGTVIPANSKGFLLNPSAFISVGTVLRYYTRALSVAQNGASTFNDPARFDQTATLLPVGTQTNCFPFRYLDAGRRSIDVSMRVRVAAQGGRISDFYTIQNMKTTVAYRSAVTQ